MTLINTLKQKFRWTGYSVCVGILAGCSAALFLQSLHWVTETREAHSIFIWFLPFAGFVMGWVYLKYGNGTSAGHNLILDEIHNPKSVLPARMAPLVFCSTLLTHLCGGSAGREGTVVQMGASLADQLSTFFRVEAEERKILLVSGAGAGFGAAIGAPFAGIVFGMEVIAVGRLRIFALWECFIASFTAYGTSRILGTHHTDWGHIFIPPFGLKTAFVIAIAGILFGTSARLFVLLTHGIEYLYQKWISYPPLRTATGGILLAILFLLGNFKNYAGLGLPVIQSAINQQIDLTVPISKMFFTALTVGSGFKGGEFIPLVFIGTTLGSALSLVLPVSFQILAATGFAAVFAGASNTPIACTIMAMELFGISIAPYALIACTLSYSVSGDRGIYRHQRS